MKVFYTVHEVLMASILGWFAIPSSRDHVLSELLWPIHLGWLCMAWLIASLSYTSSFTMTKQWSVKVCISKAMIFPGSCTVWELDCKEGRMPKNWCLWTVVLEKIPESLLDRKENKSVYLKGNQPWLFTERADAEAVAPVFWSSDVNKQLTEKAPDAGKVWGQKEKRESEDEMTGWYHWYNEHELGQTLGDGEGQGGLMCCSPWGRKESDMTGWLNNNKNEDFYSLKITNIVLILWYKLDQIKDYVAGVLTPL